MRRETMSKIWCPDIDSVATCYGYHISGKKLILLDLWYGVSIFPALSVSWSNALSQAEHTQKTNPIQTDKSFKFYEMPDSSFTLPH